MIFHQVIITVDTARNVILPTKLRSLTILDRVNLGCQTNNVMYLLKCPCGLAYMEKTTRPLKTTILKDRSNICTHETKSSSALHFTQAVHNVPTLNYCGIEAIKPQQRGGDLNSLLKERSVLDLYSQYTSSPWSQRRL